MEKLKYKGYKIKIVQDEDASNPIAEWDGNVKYALSHRRYDLQNDTDLSTDDYNSWEEFKDALVKQYRPLAILPVYMYDHSGVTIATTSFSCRWDSGQIGWAFINKATLNEWGYKSRKGYEKAIGRTLEDDIVSNVKLYDNYLSGNVWGYQVKKKGKILDSCYGYYGDSGMEDALSEAKSFVDYVVEEKELQVS